MNHRHQDRRVRLKIVVSNLRLRSHGKVRRLRPRATCGTAVCKEMLVNMCPPRKRAPRAVAGSVMAMTGLATCTLDNDGCVVCSDAGIPVRVLSLDGDDALCEDAAGNHMQVAVELVAPVRVGDALLIHGGVAIGRLEAATSAREGLVDEVRQ